MDKGGESDRPPPLERRDDATGKLVRLRYGEKKLRLGRGGPLSSLGKLRSICVTTLAKAPLVGKPSGRPTGRVACLDLRRD